ncbi:MAG: hypothetical protein AAF206_22990 [Bacteroidota bacterium]
MKHLQLLVLAAALTLLTACDLNLDNILPKNTGSWNVSRFESITRIDTSSIELAFTDAGTFTFNEDGTGQAVLNIFGMSDSASIDWNYDEEAETITIDFNDGEGPSTFDVLINEKKAQEWQAIDSTTSNGITTVETTFFSLERVDD